ncbi:UNVERIFIED_CONTAM: hypothetical protein FKN15_057044 [Acipenser sinensis]
MRGLTSRWILPMLLLGFLQPQPGTGDLQNSCPPVGDSFGNPTNRLFWEPLRVNDVKWNFEKFLVGPDGKPVKRWYPRVNVSAVRKDILEYLRSQTSQRRQRPQLPVLEPWIK